jgi:homoserine dehydrogenase
MQIDLALIGFGHVGRRFVRLLDARRSQLAHREDLRWRIVGIATRRHGAAIDPAGIPALRAAELVEADQSLAELDRGDPAAPADGRAFIPRVLALDRGAPAPPLVFVETTPLDIRAGQPAVDHVRLALEGGAHVVTANKGPVAFAYRALRDLAEARRVAFLFEGVVLDGIPVFNLVRETLPGVEIRGFRGVINWTTNFILSAMEQGRSFDAALAEMQAAGIAEADPALDVDGWDAAAKVAALANVWLGADLTPHEVARTGIRHLTPRTLHAARAQGRRIKLVAAAMRQGERIAARVAPEALGPEDPLAAADGQANVLIVDTDLAGRFAIWELGAGLTQTAYALLSDLIALGRRLGRAL